MRRKIVAGNWKMNTTPAEGKALISELLSKIADVPAGVEVIVSTPFTHLVPAAEQLSGSRIDLSAQNCANKESGAYTGEISAKMVAATGAQYVILGHSERREYYGETDAILLEKTKLALENGLAPIFCIGEKLEERESNIHFDVVKTQIETVVCQLSSEELSKVVLAYEPVWAIGTGKTATSEQAQEMHAYIRSVLTAKFGKQAEEVAILYGGSAKPGNAPELFSQPDVDGGLIGGASLVADDFIAIAKSF